MCSRPRIDKCLQLIVAEILTIKGDVLADTGYVRIWPTDGH